MGNSNRGFGGNEREEFLAVAISLGLAFLKGAVAFWTGTLSLLASALDSLLDFFASSVNLVSLIIARKQPDQDHMFGHEKAEALAGLLQAIMILLSAGYLIFSSFQRLRSPFPFRHLNEAIGVIAISMVGSLWLTYRLKRASRRTGSLVLKTDALHYAMDLYTQGGILVALALIRLSNWQWLDPAITIPISLSIGFQGWKLGKEAVDELMDRESSEEPFQVIQEIVSRHAPKVLGMHNFKTRRAGGKRFIQFHVVIKRTLSFEEVHDLTEKIVRDVREAFGNVQVIVHPDPEGSEADASDLL